MTVPATLHAQRLPGRLEYRLELPGRDTAEPTRRVFPHALSADELSALQSRCAALLHGVPNARFPEEAKAVGEMLCRSLMPEELRAELHGVAGALLVSTSVYGVPFELLYDGQFWGLRFALGRQIATDRVVRRRDAPRAGTRARALIISADPRGDLAAAHGEAERIFAALQGVADVFVLAGAQASLDCVATRIGERFDIIHYCGHIVPHGPTDSGLLLADERVLSGTAIGRMLVGAPVVFLNGCASARTTAVAGGTRWEEELWGVTGGMLIGGARAVVATGCDVADEAASAVAIEFYRRAIDGKPLGEALRLARNHARAVAPHSPSWLCFVLYGNPASPPIAHPARATSRSAALEHPTPTPSADADKTVGAVARRPLRRRWPMLVAAIVGMCAAGMLMTPGVRHRLWARTAMLCFGAIDPKTRNAFVAAADYLQNRGAPTDALYYRERAVALSEVGLGPNHVNTAIQRNNLGWLLGQLHRPAEAIGHYERALASLEVTGNEEAVAQILSNQGLAYDALRDFERAEACAQQALLLRRPLQKPRLIAESLNNLALIEHHAGRAGDARRHYEEARRMYEDDVHGLGEGNQGYVTLLNNLCVLYATQEELSAAEEVCCRGLDLGRRLLASQAVVIRDLEENLRKLRQKEGRDQDSTCAPSAATRDHQPQPRLSLLMPGSMNRPQRSYRPSGAAMHSLAGAREDKSGKAWIVMTKLER